MANIFEAYGRWNRTRLEKSLEKEDPETPGIWFPYSDSGKNQVGSKDRILKLLNETPDKDLGRRTLKLHTAVSVGILAMSILGVSYIGNKQEALAKDTTASSIKPAK